MKKLIQGGNIHNAIVPEPFVADILIEDGKITTPLRVSVITGNVMSTLNEIDGLSNEVEYLSFATGGCGKMEQYPLPVGFGGPYVRVNNISVS